MASLIRFSIPVSWQNHARTLRFAEEHGLGVEIAAFSCGDVLENETLREMMTRTLETALTGFRGERSYHGAFMDLPLQSQDHAVAGVARARVRRDMETASRLGCRTVVFHSGFNPLIHERRYLERFLDAHGGFWPEMAAAWPRSLICLENQWDPGPEPLRDLMLRIQHPQVRVCWDAAHAHAHSEASPEQWLQGLAPFIAHRHFSDNHGDRDSHLPLGEGGVPWGRILQHMRQHGGGGTTVLEMRSEDAIRRSLLFWSALESRPAQPHGVYQRQRSVDLSVPL